MASVQESADAKAYKEVFDRYDKDKNGSLDVSEVQAALAELGLPDTLADSAFQVMDTNKDGLISFEEFFAHAKASELELREIFLWIDEDSSGAITRQELGAAFHRLRLNAPEEAIDALFSRFDLNKDGSISFDEFKRIFSLLKPVDLLRMYGPIEDNEFMSDLRRYGASRGVLARPVVAQNNYNEVWSPLQTDLVRMALGGLSAVIAQSLVQPIETVKVRLQNDQQKKYPNFGRAFGMIVREEGPMGLWKGMAPSALRELSYSTLRFGLYAPIKKLVNSVGTSGGEKQQKETLLSKIVAGGLAGGIGSAIATPLDLIKTQTQASREPLRPLEVARKIVSQSGLTGLWKGMSTTVTRAVILGSVKLASYDEIKLGLASPLIGMDPKGLPIILAASVGTGLLVSLSSAPVDFARTRFMSGTKPDGTRYKSGFDVLMNVSPKMWYRGFFPQWARIAPYSIIQFVCWEQMCKLANIKAV